MENKKVWIWISLLALTLVFMFASCSNRRIKITTNEGEFSKLKSDTITVNYTAKSNKGFFASLDFELIDGKVDWEIVDSKNKTVFKGYVIYESGKVFRELTYPSNFLGGYLNNKEEIKSKTHMNGNIINIPDFNYLQFEVGSKSGEYKLKLKPTNAVGRYIVKWSNKLTRK